VIKHPDSSVTTNPTAINPTSANLVTAMPVSINPVTTMAAGQTSDQGVAISQGLDPNIGSRRMVVRTVEASDPTRFLHNVPLVVPSDDMPGSNGLYLAHQPPNNFHDQFHQTQSRTQPYWSTMNQSLYQVPPHVNARNTDFSTTQPS
jgi:hypothetical protein